jgi:glycine/D-amino acid oxidase-like deaminating enzyme/nitrite reductase/ring-hydroxylating ferredoxin subunit
MDTKPYWFNVDLPAFGTLNHDLDVDVVVVGAGLTGITAATLFKEAGATVALLERERCAAADTGHTTAHLTYVTDTRLHQLVKAFGRDCAKAFWDGGAVAMDQIESLVRLRGIQCDFEWVPGYLHQSPFGGGDKDVDSLHKDAELARELGFEAQFVEQVPYANRPGVQFRNQAKFHPRKYLAGLLEVLRAGGVQVFEHSEVSAVEDKPLQVRVGSHKVRCEYVMIATHCPIMGKTSLVSATLFQTKLALYTSYVLGARLPHDLLPEALFWDTSDPYSYLRVDARPDGDYAIFGGEDCKTGQEKEPRAVFARLEERLKEVLPMAQVQDRWLGQVVETNDGLPFIGESSGRQFVATGFCGNGFTLGTLAAMMARDQFLGKRNPWFELFDVGRRKLLGGTWRYVTENVDYPYYLLRDRFARAEVESTDSIPMGQGRIARQDGTKVAAYRDENGKLTVLSPVCTHLGCIVRWNAADRTWDCPCHGSRFKPTGEVLAGPAEDPLRKCA